LLSIRNKISKDLHDDIGSTLTSIHILSTVSKKTMDNNPAQAKQMIEEIAAQSKTIQQNMSDIVWAIRPDTSKLENLVIRMREYIGQTLEAEDIQTSFQINEAAMNYQLPIEHRKEILLIYKEAINNIIKHAGASSVIIKMDITNNHLQLVISDNGRWKQKAGSTGTGTRSMQQRAEALGGKLNIKDTDSGTTIQALIPVP
jgi:two-component system, NarL family, sensor histidine kinase UhpB